jgi:hypothetical protein
MTYSGRIRYDVCQPTGTASQPSLDRPSWLSPNASAYALTSNELSKTRRMWKSSIHTFHNQEMRCLRKAGISK